jgi:hypothetical protein
VFALYYFKHCSFASTVSHQHIIEPDVGNLVGLISVAAALWNISAIGGKDIEVDIQIYKCMLPVFMGCRRRQITRWKGKHGLSKVEASRRRSGLLLAWSLKRYGVLSAWVEPKCLGTES